MMDRRWRTADAEGILLHPTFPSPASFVPATRLRPSTHRGSARAFLAILSPVSASSSTWGHTTLPDGCATAVAHKWPLRSSHGVAHVRADPTAHCRSLVDSLIRTPVPAESASQLLDTAASAAVHGRLTTYAVGSCRSASEIMPVQPPAVLAQLDQIGGYLRAGPRST